MQKEQPKISTNEHLVPRNKNILTLEQIAQIQDHKTGGKAKNLAELSVNGFPVPTAVGISVEVFAQYQKTGQIDSELVQELERIRQRFGGKVALRSSATGEDGHDLSMAGVFETVYLQSDDKTVEESLIKIYEQAQSPEVQEYLSLQQKASGQVEMAVVLQKLIEPDLAGVIYTNVDGGDTLIQYTLGFGNQLVDGKTEGSTVLYSESQQQIVKSKNTDLAKIPTEILKTLTRMATQIKGAFDNLPQDIEFAISDGEIYILQARPLTTEINDINLEMSREDLVQHTQEQIKQIVAVEKAELGLESVILSDSNFSELLPRPTEMDFGVFAYIFTGSDGVPGAIQLGRQQMGYLLGDESVGYMHYVGGKPYFSIAKDAHTFYAGFPDTKDEYNQTLVAEYLSQINLDPVKGSYPEMGLYLQDPREHQLINRYGEKKGAEYFAVAQQFKENLAEQAKTFSHEYLLEGKPATDQFIESLMSQNLKELSVDQLVNEAESVLEHLRTVSCVNFVKAARLGFYYSQRLKESIDKYFNVLDLYYDDDYGASEIYQALSQGLDGSEITESNLKVARAQTLDEAMEIGRQVVGHYSTGEMLEIRHPRLKDYEQGLHDYVEGIYSAKDQYIIQFEKQRSERLKMEQYVSNTMSHYSHQDEFIQIMRSAQTYMSLRETVKYQFVKEYSILRDILVEIAHRMGVEENAIFSLFPREIGDFVDHPEQFLAEIAERQERFDKYPLLDLPSVIRESDIDQLGDEDDEEVGATFELLGKLLAQGQILAEAIIVNLEDFETIEAAREILIFYRNQALPIVLVAAQLNLSHDPLIAQADGLIIENAGFVSHGAQRARELGRGAIGGIKTKHFKTGDTVNFNPFSKRVEKLKGPK